jgi:hypothetical protein
VTYILDVLGRLGQQRVASRDVVTTSNVKTDITSVTGNDDRILVKIVDLAFVPISTVLTVSVS